MLQMACNMEGSSTTSMHLYLQSPISCQLRVPLNLDELIPKMDQFFCFQFFQHRIQHWFSEKFMFRWSLGCFFVQNKSSWTGSIDLLDLPVPGVGDSAICAFTLASQCTGHLAMLKMHWQLCFFLSCRFTIERGGNSPCGYWASFRRGTWAVNPMQFQCFPRWSILQFSLRLCWTLIVPALTARFIQLRQRLFELPPVDGFGWVSHLVL
jgi:hypothetical protein